MKKSLSVLLSVAMSASMFASVAFGADANLDAKAKYDAMVQAGIFDGFEDGQAHLDRDMTRAQFAKILTLVFNLKEATGNSYTDIDGHGWAAGYIEAVTKAGLMDGVANGKFAPGDNVTLEQLATVLVRGLKLNTSNKAVDGNVSDWAKGYVATAIENGLISASKDYTKPAIRENLVDSSYVAWKKVEDSNVAPINATFAATGKRELQVQFNNPVDTAAAKVEVTRDGVSVKLSTKWSNDKKTATLTSTVNLIQGEYAIKVTGAAANDLTGKVTIEEEKVAKVVIDSDTAPALLDSSYRVTGVDVYYKVLNQYNEDITKTASINWTSSLGAMGTSGKDGVVRFEVANPDHYFLRVGDKITVNAYETSANISVSKTMTVGEKSKPTNINVKSLWNAEGKELYTNSDMQSFYLLLDVKDQYGNSLKAEDLKGEVNVTSSNPMYVNVNADGFLNNVGPKGDELGLRLSERTQVEIFTDGVATINFLPIGGGSPTSYSLNVKKAGDVQTFTMSPPSTVIGIGDTVEIPFTAVDQYGQAVTKYEDFFSKTNDQPKVILNATTGNLRFERDYATDKAVLKYTAPSQNSFINTNVVFNASVQYGGKYSSLTIPLKETKYPAQVNRIDLGYQAVQVGAATHVKGDTFRVVDQYGENFALDAGGFYDKYGIALELTSGLQGKFVIMKDNQTLTRKTADNKNITVSDSTYARERVIERAKELVVLNDAKANDDKTKIDNYTEAKAYQDALVEYSKANIVQRNDIYMIYSLEQDYAGNAIAPAAGQVKASIVALQLDGNGDRIKPLSTTKLLVPIHNSTNKRDVTGSSDTETALRSVKVDDIVDFEIGEVPTIVDITNSGAPDPRKETPAKAITASEHKFAVEFWGKTAAGTKVNVKNSSLRYALSTGLSVERYYDMGDKTFRVQADKVYFAENQQQTKGTLTVQYFGKDNNVLVRSKDVTISKEKPVAQKVAFGNTHNHNTATWDIKHVNGVVYVAQNFANNKEFYNGILQKVDFKDQYNKDMVDWANHQVIISSAKDKDGNAKSSLEGYFTFESKHANGAYADGDAFTVTVIRDTIVQTFKVVIVGDAKEIQNKK